MDSDLNIYQWITNTSIAVWGVVGIFVIFWLQWLRKEIDDYRMRLIRCLFDSHPIKLREEVRNKHLLSEQLNNKNKLYGLNDEELKKLLESVFEKIPKSKTELRYTASDGSEVILEHAWDVFKKRFNLRNNIHTYFLITSFFFVISLFWSVMHLSLVGQVGIELLIYGVGIFLIVLYLLFFIKKV